LENFEERMLQAVEKHSKPIEKDVLDEYELFCRAIASKLRRIADKNCEAAAIAQFKIHEILFKAEFGQLDTGNNE